MIAEADNESHGTQSQYLKDSNWENVSRKWNERISDNPEFIPATLDRTKLAYTGKRTALVLLSGLWEMNVVMAVLLRKL